MRKDEFLPLRHMQQQYAQAGYLQLAKKMQN
jgi:hypothetical protein